MWKRSKNKSNVRIAILVPLCLAFIAACAPRRPSPPSHEDGIYRGVFIDRDRIEIAVEVRLENGVVTAASFRHLRHCDDFRMENEDEPYRSVIQQYREALEYLVGKDLAAHLPDLYRPERVVNTEVDGFTQATVRANKIISAVRDALNRGVYSYE